MKRIHKRWQVLFSSVARHVAVFVFGLISCTPLLGNGGDLVYSLVPTNTEFSLHEPVFVELQVRNALGRSVQLDLGKNFKGNLAFTVSGAPGLLVNVSEEPNAGGISFPDKVVLSPGAIVSRPILLNEWFEFGEPGEYGVTLARRQTLLEGAQANGTPIATAVIRITPRDPDRLSRTCKRLASEALKEDAETASTAARAFGYVEDATCLPDHVRLLSGSFHGKEGAISGLARIGTGEAIAAIVDAWDELRWDQQALAYREFESRGRRHDLVQALRAARKENKQVFGDQRRHGDD